MKISLVKICLVVLDSGCTKTLCGEEWLNCYLDTLSEKEQKEIQTVKSDTELKFGDGQSVSSERSISISCRIARKSETVETDVVKSKIPLLLNKNSMKKANKKLILPMIKSIYLVKRLIYNLQLVDF